MLWHDTMHVLLGPETVDYRIYRPLERKAMIVDSVPCAAAGAPQPWSAAGATLRGILQEERPRRLRLEVTLSDRFVRYQVLPWRSGLTTRAEWRAYALHCFESIHGEAVRDWSVRLDIVPPGRESLACAIDTELIATLHGIAADGFSRVAAIRPGFVANYGKRRSSLRGGQFWFAVAEARHLCLGAWRDGYWVAVRNEPAPDGWRAALPGLLRRSQCTLAEPCAGDLYLCGAGAKGNGTETYAIDATTVRILPTREPARTKTETSSSASLSA